MPNIRGKSSLLSTTAIDETSNKELPRITHKSGSIAPKPFYFSNQDTEGTAGLVGKIPSSNFGYVKMWDTK